MLTQQLRDLERDGIIHRKVYAVVPPKVHYSLTDYGQTLKPSLALMCAWEAGTALAEPAGAAERGLRDDLIPWRFQAKVLRR